MTNKNYNENNKNNKDCKTEKRKRGSKPEERGGLKIRAGTATGRGVEGSSSSRRLRGEQKASPGGVVSRKKK